MDLKKSTFVLLLLAFCFTASAVVLQDGTDVAVRLVENVNGNMNFTGESVYFQVVDDVKVGNDVVITAGTFVKGLVNEAEGRKSMGKGGKLTLVPRSLKTPNGDLVKFERNPLSQEGRKRTGATVAHVVMWGPLGLFAKGRAAFMFRETEFDITVDGDYELQPVEDANKKPTEEMSEFMVSFVEYKSKINYRKGKIGKDFMVSVANSDDYDVKDVEIVAVDGHELPKPIKPITIKSDRKNPSMTHLVFEFKDIVKYALPESSNFEFQINETHRSDAQLNTKWKLK